MLLLRRWAVVAAGAVVAPDCMPIRTYADTSGGGGGERRRGGQAVQLPDFLRVGDVAER